jgi:hypothetical protein
MHMKTLPTLEHHRSEVGQLHAQVNRRTDASTAGDNPPR